jgi:hypothetical protein
MRGMRLRMESIDLVSATSSRACEFLDSLLGLGSDGDEPDRRKP